MTPPVPQENREEKEKNEEKMKEELRTKFGELLSELNKADAPYALSVANRLYGEKTFEFIQVCSGCYGGKRNRRSVKIHAT